MVNFARDNFLGSYDEFRSRYEKPIMDGDVTRSKELIEKLQDVVLRRGKTLLNKQLPPKMEWILYCKLSPLQHRLYCDFLDYYGESEDGKANADLLTAYAALLQVMNHPDIIYSKLCPHDGEAEADEDAEQQLALSRVNEWAWESEERLLEKKQVAAAQLRKRRQKITDRQKSYEWARSVIFGDLERSVRVSPSLGSSPNIAQNAASIYRTEVLENSGKMAVLMRIIEESFACGDKVVVFSQSVPTLKVIGDFLRASEFNPNREADLARKLKAETSSSDKVKRRRLLVPPKRDPAGIIRKRTNESGGKRRKPTASSNVSADTWFLQIDGGTSGAKRMEYIQVRFGCFCRTNSVY
jgi:SNF2 family DNA or RNA helicase